MYCSQLGQQGHRQPKRPPFPIELELASNAKQKQQINKQTTAFGISSNSVMASVTCATSLY